MSNGFSFNDLSITKKIHAITSISVVVFLVSALINYSAMVDNKQALDELQTTSYKVVQLATSNKFLLEKLDDLYTQAVTFGDGELVDKADITKAEIFDHLKELNALDKSYQNGSEIKHLNSDWLSVIFFLKRILIIKVIDLLPNSLTGNIALFEYLFSDSSLFKNLDPIT